MPSPTRRLAGASPPACSSFLALLLVSIFVASCAATESTERPLPGTRFDHVVVFAEGEALFDWLEVHLTHAEALNTRHEGQGTRGRYFLLLNAFVEVLTLEDAEEARSNEGAFGSPYVPRWQSDEAAPVAIGLTLDESSFAEPPFAHVRYRESDGGSGYVMASGNADLAAPLIYATGPARAYPVRASVDEVDSIQDEGRRETVRRYLTHPSGVKALTDVLWRSPALGLTGTNAELLRGIAGVSLEPALDHELVLEFDHAEKGREVRFAGRPSVVLRY